MESQKSSSSGFEAERQVGAAVPVVHLRGELDLESVPRCREVLEPALEEGPSVVLNLGDLSFVDSTGLALFASAHKTLTTRGQSLVLVAPQPVTRRVLEIVGLDREFAIFEEESQGIAYALSRRTEGA
jgi:anti-sigma B factor antagonist